ncbi:MAG: hypothetical protein HY851_12215 [candidate division Zixibacteria bacterium]|nr:hypothetical protein [candidate division Zixibacteria bacterium]
MRKAVAITVLLSIIGLLALRFVHLDADPPTMLAPYGQSVLTDPYLYTWHAREATLFPNDQHDYERFAPLKYTAMTGMARGVFAIAGVSRVTANVASLLLCLGGMLFWLLGLKRFWSGSRVTVAALLLLANGVLMIYGRMPYLENGLIFLSGLTFYIHSRLGGARRGQFLTGVAIAAAALCGKLFGILVVVPVVLTPMIVSHRISYRPTLMTIGGIAVGAGAYLALCMGGNWEILWRYHSDTANLLHFSPFLSQWLGPVGLFVSFGSESGLNLFGIGAIVVACIGTIFWLATRNLKALAREDTPVVFSLIWLCITMAVFLPFEFRPLRYLTVGMLPAVTLGVSLIDYWKTRWLIVARPRWLTLGVILLASMFLCTQIISYVAAVTRVFIGFKTILPWCVAFSVLVTGLILWGARRKSTRIPFWLGKTIIVLVGAIYLASNGRDIAAALTHATYDLKTLNRETSEILSPDAVVTGSYAPALTIDSRLNGVFNYLGTVRPDPTFFERFHPTHIISNTADWQEIRKDYPETRFLPSMIEPTIWSYNVQVISLPDSTYHPTLFEQAARLGRMQKYDSALFLLDAFDRAHPHNRLSAVTRINLHFSRGDRAELITPLVDRLLVEFPEDFFAIAFAANAYDRLHQPQKSRECLERCKRLNPNLRPRREGAS